MFNSVRYIRCYRNIVEKESKLIGENEIENVVRFGAGDVVII